MYLSLFYKMFFSYVLKYFMSASFDPFPLGVYQWHECLSTMSHFLCSSFTPFHLFCSFLLSKSVLHVSLFQQYLFWFLPIPVCFRFWNAFFFSTFFLELYQLTLLLSIALSCLLWSQYLFSELWESQTPLKILWHWVNVCTAVLLCKEILLIYKCIFPMWLLFGVFLPSIWLYLWLFFRLVLFLIIYYL